MASFTEISLIASIKGLTEFNSGTAQMRRQMGLLGKSASSASGIFDNSMGRVGQSVTNAGRTIRGFGNELTFLGFQLTFLATGAFAAVTQAGSEFESTVVRMSTLANVATSDLGELAAAAQRLGPQLGVGPTELADAMFDIVSSGFTAAEALEIIESTAKGAAIGLGDVRTVTDAVTSAMRAFASDGLTASRATDILVQAVREGKGEVDALAGTIGRVLGIAAELGLTFEEVSAFIATFTRVGVPAEVAVTSLRSALTNILKPTQAAKDALAEYGTSMDEIKRIIDERGLAAGLFTLAAILGDDSEAMGKVIGSARALAGVLINTGPLAEDYRQILGAIGEEADQTAEAFAIFAQTTEFRVNAAKAAFESLFITVSNTMRPLVNAILDAVPKITTAIEDMVRANPKIFLLAGAFAAVVATMGPLLIIVGLAITSIGTLITVVGGLITVLAGILSPLGAVIAGLTAFVVTFVGLFVASFQKTKQKLDEQGRSISINAFAWGRNIVVQFARGMASAIVAVFQVLAAIGRAIRRLLRPGSPPKLLPDLDKWGKGAMEAWLEGWAQADFNVFQGISSTIESFLRSMQLPEIDVVPTIMGIRTSLAELIETFRTTGSVSMDAIGAIAANFGSASAVVAKYIRAMLELQAANQAVERAQQALNDVQRKYNELLKPISDELDDIADRRQEIADNMRIAELQQILNDPNAPALAKELAALELREIELRRQQDAIEETRDAEVDRAQEALDAAEAEAQAAEDRVQALQQFIQVQEQNNALIKEQIALLERLAESLGDLGGGAGLGEELGLEEEDLGLGGVGDIGGLPLDIDDILPPDLSEEIDMFVRKLGAEELGLGGEGGGLIDSLFGDVTGAADELIAEFSGIGTEIAAAWQPVIDAGNELTDIWSDVFSIDLSGTPLGEFLSGFDPLQILENVAAPFVEFGEIVSGVFGSLGGEGGEGEGAGILQTIAGWFNDLGISINDVITWFIQLNPIVLALQVPFVIFGTIVGWIQGQVEGFINILASVIPVAQIVWQVISTAAINIATSIGTWVSETSIKISLWAQDVLKKIETWAADTKKDIETWVSDTKKSIETWVKDVIKAIAQFIIDAVANFQSLFDQVFGEEGILANIVARGKEIFENLKSAIVGEDGNGGVLGELKSSVETAFGNILTSIISLADSWFSAGVELARGLIEGILSLLEPFIEEIKGIVDAILGGAEETAEQTSPSKRTMRLGRDIMLGLKIGMEELYGPVRDSLSEFMDATLSEASAVASLAEAASNPAAGVSAMPTTTNNIMTRASEFGPINVYNGMDLATLLALIRQELNAAL